MSSLCPDIGMGMYWIDGSASAVYETDALSLVILKDGHPFGLLSAVVANSIRHYKLPFSQSTAKRGRHL